MKWSEWGDIVFLNLFKSESSWVQFRKSIGYYLFLTVDMGALPTLCLRDILVNLRLCCEPVVMVFYFGFAVLCVFFLYFVRILWYFSPCRKIWGNLSGCWEAHFCCFNVFCFLSFPPWCNVIGSDLFFCKSNYGSKCGCKTHYFHLFLFVSLLQYLSLSLFFCLIILLWNSPI